MADTATTSARRGVTPTPVRPAARGRAPRAAWALVVVSVVCVVLDTWVVSRIGPLWSGQSVGYHGWPQLDLAAAGSATMGALVLATHRRHPIGLVLNVVGAVTSVSLLTESIGLWSKLEGGPDVQTVGNLSAWIAAPLGGPLALAGLTLMFLVAPDGRLVSPRWRLVAYGAVLGYLLFLVGTSGVPPSEAAGREGPSYVPDWAQLLIGAGAVLVAVMLALSVISLVLRLRGSVGEVRQQLRWITVGAACVGVALVVLLSAQAVNGGDATWQTNVPLSFSYAFLLVAVSVAVLKYRLYDLDLFVSRALVLAAATAFVAVGYVVAVVVVGAAFGDRADGFWPSLLATVVVALAFQPLRSRVVRLADRLAYGPRAAPYLALAELSRDAGRSVSPDAVLAALAEMAGGATRARRTTATLAVEGRLPVRADWPPEPSAVRAGDVETHLTISDAQGPLGGLGVLMPVERPLRAWELRLLQDLVDQSALPLRNAQLELELGDQVRLLDQRAEELSASRRRLIESADDERRRLEAAVSREVLPLLSRLRADLSSEPGSVPAGDLVPLATGALERLRELTRGFGTAAAARAGLGVALTSELARRGLRDVVTVDPDVSARRFSTRVETTLCFCALEAVSRTGSLPADRPHVSLGIDGDELVLVVRGVRPDPPALLAMSDRVEACAGTLEVDAATVTVRLPVPDQTMSSSSGPPASPAPSSAPSAPSASWDQAATRRSGPKTPLGT